MVPKRVRLARLLDRAGVVRGMLEARARALLPQQLMVLTFHRVADARAPRFDPDVADTTPERFERQVATVQRYFTLVDTRDLDAYRAGAPLPRNPAMITFDDGYRDNHDVALPILRRLGARAVFFVASGYVADRRLYWWERLAWHLQRAITDRLRLGYPEPMVLDVSAPDARERARARLLALVKERPGLDLDRFLDELGAAAGSPLPRGQERELAGALIMDWDQVRALRDAGMDVQSHTHRHRVLASLDEDEAARDLDESRRTLEAELERPVRAVAYPSGRRLHGRPDLRRAVQRAGLRIGFTSGTGAARLGRGGDWLDVARMAVDGHPSETFFRGRLAFPALAY